MDRRIGRDSLNEVKQISYKQTCHLHPQQKPFKQLSGLVLPTESKKRRHKYMHTHGIGSMHLTCLCKYHKLVYIRIMHMHGVQWLAQGHLSSAQEVVIYQCTLLATCWSSKLITDPPVPKPIPKPLSSKPLTMWGAILAPRSVSALTADFD